MLLGVCISPLGRNLDVLPFVIHILSAEFQSCSSILDSSPLSTLSFASVFMSVAHLLSHSLDRVWHRAGKSS